MPVQSSRGPYVTIAVLIVTVAMGAAKAQVEPVSGEFRVDTESPKPWRPPATAIHGDGAFIVVWDGGGPQGVQGRRYDRDGRALGPQFQLSDSPTYDFTPAPVSAQPNGDFLVAWAGPEEGVKARRFDSTGSPREDGFRVTGSAYWGLGLAAGANGNFVVAWSDYYSTVGAVLYDGSGRRLKSLSNLDLGGYFPQVAMDEKGEFVAVWSKDFRTGQFGEILGRRFDSHGEAIGGELEINTHTLGHQYGATLGMAPDGRFVVVWTSEDQDGDGLGAFGQRFDAFGQRLGGEFRISRQTALNQSEPSVAMGTGGDFFVAWTGAHEATGPSIYGQYFDRQGRRIGAEIVVSASTSSMPSAALAADGTLVVAWLRQSDGGQPEVAARRFAVKNLGDADPEGDGVPSSGDNCPTVFNPEQADVDDNGYGDACVSLDAFLSPSARIGTSPMIGRGSTVGDGVVIGDDAHLGEHVTLDRGVRAGHRFTADDFVWIGRRATLGDDVTIGFASRVEGTATIGSQVTIGDRVVVRRNVGVGDGATIEPLVILYANARVGAGAIVEMGARVGRGAMVAPGAVVPAGTTVPPFTTFP